MSSPAVDSTNDRGNQVIDVLIFAAAVGMSVLAVVELGVLGLGVGCVLLSGAAALVVGRQEDAVATDRVATTDGGHRQD